MKGGSHIEMKVYIREFIIIDTFKLKYKNISVSYFCLQEYVKYTLIRPVESLPRQITLTITRTIWTVSGRYNFTLPCLSR